MWETKKLETKYNSLVLGGAWFNVLVYGGIGAAIFGSMIYFDTSISYITPILIIYAVAAIAHMLGYGFMAINVQMKITSDHWDRIALERFRWDENMAAEILSSLRKQEPPTGPAGWPLETKSEKLLAEILQELQKRTPPKPL